MLEFIKNVQEDESCTDEEEYESLTKDMDYAENLISEEIEKNTDMDEIVQKVSDSTDKGDSRQERRRKLRNHIEYEVNKKTSFYHPLIFQTLKNSKSDWSSGLSKPEIHTFCEKIIDTGVDIFMQRHFDEFDKKIQEANGSNSIYSWEVMLALSGIAAGIIERVAADAVTSGASKVINEFMERTGLEPEHISEALELVLETVLNIV